MTERLTCRAPGRASAVGMAVARLCNPPVRMEGARLASARCLWTSRCRLRRSTRSLPRQGAPWHRLCVCRNVANASAERSHADMTDDFGRLHNFFLTPDQRLATGQAAATILGVDYKKLRSCKTRLASALVQADRDSRAQLEAAIGALGSEACLLYVDAFRSDETPLPTRAALPAAPSVQEGPSLPQGGELAEISDKDRLTHHSYNVPLCSGSATVSRKLLQSEQKFGMLLRAPASGEAKFLTIVGSTVNWLQFLQRTTAECLKSASDKTCGVSTGVAPFPLKIRLVVEDQAASNERCERALQEERAAADPSWVRLHFACQVHKTALVFKKCMNLVGPTISGQMHFALVVNFGTGIHTWREELADTIRERLDIRFGRPPPDSIEHKRQVLRLCLARGPRRVEKLMALHALPNGDWRNPARVECYLPVGATPDAAAIADIMARGIIRVAAASKFTIFPRHRWTRADEAMDQLILLEACHSLASVVFPRWVRRVSQKSTAQQHPATSATSTGADRGNGPGLLPIMDAHCADGDGRAAVALAEGSAAQPPGIADDQANSRVPQSAADNERHRSVAAAWLASKPLGHCLVTRLAMEPLREYLAKQLVFASDNWERKQEVIDAKHAQTPELNPRRQWRLTMAVNGRTFQGAASRLVLSAGLLADLAAAPLPGHGHAQLGVPHVFRQLVLDV